MKKIIVLSFMTVLVISATAQKKNTFKNSILKNEINTINTFTNRADNFSIKQSTLQLNRKKSQDLISIKAYRKATQLRSKQIRIC